MHISDIKSLQITHFVFHFDIITTSSRPLAIIKAYTLVYNPAGHSYTISLYGQSSGQRVKSTWTKATVVNPEQWLEVITTQLLLRLLYQMSSSYARGCLKLPCPLNPPNKGWSQEWLITPLCLPVWCLAPDRVDSE